MVTAGQTESGKAISQRRWLTGHLTAVVGARVPQIVWAGSLVLGAYLRWAYVELSEFGADQNTALHYAHALRRGWDLPVVGMASSVGPYFGPGEYYVMLPPQFISDAPEVSIYYVGLLGLIAGAWFSLVVWRYFGRRTGLATMLFFSCGPWAVYFTRKIWTPDTLPLFSAAAFSFLLLALIRRRWWALPAATFTLGFATQVHHSAIGMLPAVLVALLVFWRRLRLWQVALSGVTFVLPASLYIWHAWHNGPQELVGLWMEVVGSGPLVLVLAVLLIAVLVGGLFFLLARR
ncbi:MAG: glycosyltransferase family 39 protein [Dehalococcoidales bacterium]|nr:glycosyltransferase family 39 protein [Dehalococcoidales bacterium]